MMLRIKGFIRNCISSFLSALFPEEIKCWCCEAELHPGENALCTACRGRLKRAPYHPVSQPLDGLSSAYRYDDVSRIPIHRFKYSGHTYLAAYLTQDIPLPEGAALDILVPVPLHEKKLRERGYNQSELLCIALSKRWSIPFSTSLLVRLKNTPSQTTLTDSQRKANMKKAFSAKSCVGLTIGLVDDVITSGATMMACAEALKAAGAVKVYAIAVANAMH